MILQNTTFDQNSASGDGGCIGFQAVRSLVEMRNNKYINNRAGRNGGALSISQHTEQPVNIQDSVFNNNTAGFDGGGIYISDS